MSNRPTNQKKASDEQIIESYYRLKSIWKVAKELGMCGQSVHERVKKLNILFPVNYWKKHEIEILKNAYSLDFKCGDNIL